MNAKPMKRIAVAAIAGAVVFGVGLWIATPKSQSGLVGDWSAWKQMLWGQPTKTAKDVPPPTEGALTEQASFSDQSETRALAGATGGESWSRETTGANWTTWQSLATLWDWSEWTGPNNEWLWQVSKAALATAVIVYELQRRREAMKGGESKLPEWVRERLRRGWFRWMARRRAALLPTIAGVIILVWQFAVEGWLSSALWLFGLTIVTWVRLAEVLIHVLLLPHNSREMTTAATPPDTNPAG